MCTASHREITADGEPSSDVLLEHSVVDQKGCRNELRNHGIQASCIRTLVESNQWLKNWYLSLPNHALGIIRIGQGLVGSVSGKCDRVGYQVMVLVAWSPSTLKSPWVRTVTTGYPDLIWPYLLPGGNTPTTNHHAVVGRALVLQAA